MIRRSWRPLDGPRPSWAYEHDDFYKVQSLENALRCASYLARMLFNTLQVCVPLFKKAIPLNITLLQANQILQWVFDVTVAFSFSNGTNHSLNPFLSSLIPMPRLRQMSDQTMFGPPSRQS